MTARTAPSGSQLATVLVAAMAVSTFAMFAIGTLAPALVAEFDLSRTRLGLLTTAMFLVAGITSLSLSWIADSLRARMGYALLFLIGAASLAAIGLARSFWWLVAAVAIGGVSQAFANPVTNRILAAHAPAGRQGLIMGFKQSGVQVGGVIAGFSLPWLATAVGWRAALGLSAVGALLAMVVGLWLLPDIPQRAAGPRAEQRAASRPTRATWWLALFALLMGSGAGSANAHLSLYANEHVGLSAPVAGMTIGLIGLLATAGRISVGRISDRLEDLGAPLRALAAMAGAAFLLLVISTRAGHLPLWAGTALLGGSFSWNTVTMLAIVRDYRKAGTGRASGTVMTGFFAGFIVAPVTFGRLVDVTGSYELAWGLLAIASFVAIPVVGGWRRRRGLLEPTTQ